MERVVYTVSIARDLIFIFAALAFIKFILFLSTNMFSILRYCINLAHKL